VIEPTGSLRDAASTIFNLPDYRVLNAVDLPDGER
jgi:transposase